MRGYVYILSHFQWHFRKLEVRPRRFLLPRFREKRLFYGNVTKTFFSFLYTQSWPWEWGIPHTLWVCVIPHSLWVRVKSNATSFGIEVGYDLWKVSLQVGQAVHVHTICNAYPRIICNAHFALMRISNGWCAFQIIFESSLSPSVAEFALLCISHYALLCIAHFALMMCILDFALMCIADFALLCISQFALLCSKDLAMMSIAAVALMCISDFASTRIVHCALLCIAHFALMCIAHFALLYSADFALMSFVNFELVSISDLAQDSTTESAKTAIHIVQHL